MIIKLIVVRIVGRFGALSTWSPAKSVAAATRARPVTVVVVTGGSGALLCFEFLQVKTDLFLASARARGGEPKGVRSGRVDCVCLCCLRG